MITVWATAHPAFFLRVSDDRICYRAASTIRDVKRWLGHTVSSDVADLYMRPVRPEYRKTDPLEDGRFEHDGAKDETKGSGRDTPQVIESLLRGVARPVPLWTVRR